jgi:DNA-binding NarL/FixJ family response regulator
MAIKIVIVEDEMLIRMQLSTILKKFAYEVSATYANSDHFLNDLPDLEADLILFDINIKGSKDGIALAHIVRSQYSIPFVFVTSYADKETIEAAKQTRPNGYIVKPFDERDIMTTLEIALFNANHQSKSGLVSKAYVQDTFNITLTEREYITLTDLAQGLTNGQIAAKQFVSINTVKTHLKNLYAKLEVNDRVNMVKKVLGV